MNREIKFRGLSDNQDGTTEMVFGDLIHLSEGWTAYAKTHPHRIAWKIGGTHYNKPVRKGTLGQFTGLTDKNGVDIFEGDVLAIPDDVVVENIGGYDRTEPTNHLLQVVYNVTRASFGTAHGTFAEMTDNYGSSNTWEVVGNIYENPDLVRRKE